MCCVENVLCKECLLTAYDFALKILVQISFKIILRYPTWLQ